MMAALKLGGRRNFLEKYLTPAINAGLVEMTQPDSPRSPTQRYRLTAWGQKAKASLGEVRSSPTAAQKGADEPSVYGWCGVRMCSGQNRFPSLAAFDLIGGWI